MRHIGQISDETQARTFCDFLVGRGIPGEVEHDGGSWTLWIVNEEHVPAAQEWLEKFRSDPNAAEFQNASDEAARARQAQADDLAAYRKRIHTRKSLFPQFGGYGIGPLTYALIALCLLAAFYTGLGTKETARSLFISDPVTGYGRFLPEVFAGEVWRLFTPAFIHLGLLHLLFNLMWLYHLGCMIEARRSTWHLALLVSVFALCSNVGQYLVKDAAFGGMSGVVYGLVGYVWIRAKFDRACGLFMDRTNLIIILAWYVICFTGLLPIGIANTAHTVGLLLGMAWGRLAAYQAARRPE